MNHRWTEADCALLIELYNTGMTIPAIGRKMGVSEDAAAEKVARLRAAGADLAYRRKPANPFRRKHRKKDVKAGKPRFDHRSEEPPTPWGWFLRWNR